MADFITTFFNEKDLADKTYEVEAPNGDTHLIPTGCVIEAIQRTAGQERAQIESILRQLDFANGDIHHFLNHLAKGLAANF
jgi:hypothetical protein